MNKTRMIVAAATLAAVGMSATAQEGPWMVRARAVHLQSDNGGGTTPNLDLSINDKWIPEVDFSYFFTPNIAAELILTYPQKQTIYSAGQSIGTLKHLPPTLTLQYHFIPNGTIRPYVGAGLNYTRFSSVHFDPAVQAALQPSISNSSWGLAVQAGVDYEVAPNIFINLDAKKVQIQTDVRSAGVKVGDFKVDPWLLSVGVGYRF